MIANSGRLTASGGWCAPRSALDALGITITDQEPPMNEPRTYIKKPVAIRALRWTGDNTEEIREFTDGGFEEVPPDELFGRVGGITAEVWDKLHSTWVGVKTGQWIIEGVQGEHYPCDPDVFTATYEEQA